VTAVERGYNLYEANCARCHGIKGEGGLGPILNDQSKLFSHLSEQYLHNVLTVGGRYVCGDAKSIMPVWAETNGGPLNYLQIEDIISFIRAPSTQEYPPHPG
jgi:mono/diheme cytochrome c family protein